ncbi:MAG: toll/interleukin-1 receptor domain-containing protein, partial [Pirellulaceae bacterium]
MMHDVFLSHSSKDKEVADAVCESLESQEIGCWVAPRDIRVGVEWGEAIVEAIEDAKVFVVIISSHSNESPHVKREIERAVNKGLSIIPVRIDDVPLSKALEYFLGLTHWLDATTPPLQDHLETLTSR